MFNPSFSRLLDDFNFGHVRVILLGIAQVDICCFDKTGTLTSDDMVLEGLTGLPGRGQGLLTDMKQVGQEVARVLAACQALIQVEGKFVGDPLEKAAFSAVGKTPTCALCKEATSSHLRVLVFRWQHLSPSWLSMPCCMPGCACVYTCLQCMCMRVLRPCVLFCMPIMMPILYGCCQGEAAIQVQTGIMLQQCA